MPDTVMAEAGECRQYCNHTLCPARSVTIILPENARRTFLHLRNDLRKPTCRTLRWVRPTATERLFALLAAQ